MKLKNTFFIVLIIMITLSNGIITKAADTGSGSSAPGAAQTPEAKPEDVQYAVNGGKDASGNLKKPTTATTPDGRDLGLGGNVDVKRGKVKKADSLTYNGANMQGFENFDQSGPDFWLDFVKSLFHNGLSIINGRGVSFLDGILSVQEYDSFTGVDSVSTDGINLSTKQNEIYIKKADNLISDTLTFENISETNFKIYNNAVIAELKKGEMIKITDSDGNEVSFESIGENSSIIVSKDVPPMYKITKGILKATIQIIKKLSLATTQTN